MLKNLPNHWVGAPFKCAGIVKYSTSLPCICLSESDLKLYTKFAFCEGKDQKY